MIEIEIPKDVRDYEAKLIGPFTTRQLFCFLGLVGACFLTYKGTSALLGKDSSFVVILTMIAAIPFGLVGWFKPYGMHFEKFAKSVFISTILAPAKRLYKIENLYDNFDKMIDNEEKAKIAKTTNNAVKPAKKPKKKGGDSLGG